MLKIFILTGIIISLFPGPPARAANPLDRQVEIERQTDADEITKTGRRIRDLNGSRKQDAAIFSPGDDRALGEQRILKRKSDYQPFSIFASASQNWISNVALTKQDIYDDWYTLGVLGASYQPLFTSTLIGEATVTQQWYRYNRFSQMDFDSLNAGGGLSLLMPRWKQLIVFCRYNYNRLSDRGITEESFHNHTLTIGLFKSFPLARAHYLYGGLSSELGFAVPDVYQRDRHSAVAGYYLDITPKVAIDLSARMSYVPYQQNAREDYNESLSLGLTYRHNAMVTVNVSAMAAFNQSNQSVFQYEVFNAGPGVGLKIKF